MKNECEYIVYLVDSMGAERYCIEGRVSFCFAPEAVNRATRYSRQVARNFVGRMKRWHGDDPFSTNTYHYRRV